MSSFDIFILWAYNKNLIEAQILAEHLVRNKKTVIDETVGSKFIPSKVFEASKLAEYKINHPKTFQALKFSVWEDMIKKMKFPVVVKPLYGQKGQGVKKISNKKEALKFFKKNPKGFLMQEYLPVNEDIRIFIVDSKALGAIKRSVAEKDFRSNVSLGAETKKASLSREMRAARAMNYEVAGVDLIVHKNKIYVLEVNSTP